MRRWVGGLFAFVFVFALVSAVSSPANAQRRWAPAATQVPERVCIPGAQFACSCPDGRMAIQLCNTEGSMLMACQCQSFAATPRALSSQVPVRGLARHVWYGNETLIADGIGLGIIVGGASLTTSSPSAGIAIGAIGGLWFTFAAPAVHWRRGFIARGFADLFGLRIGLPLGVGLLGYGIGYGAYGGNSGTANIVAGVFGLLGLLATIGIDAGVLAYDDGPPTP
jgi:hypothetical protein